MAPEALKQKPREKQTFDDDLGDDFLSSWKPSKSLSALDFEDDDLVPKNSKASFSLAKMDTNFDFDFTGGINALSNFNVDISDLDLPSKTSKAKGSSQEKALCSSKKGDSKFSFQFKGFDEFDLDDTLKMNKELDTSVHSRKEQKDCTPLSLTNKYGKKGFLDTSSDNVSESTTMANTSKTSTKDSEKDLKGDPALIKGKIFEGFTFSDDESSQHEPDFPRVDNHEQTSDYCTPQRRRDLDIKESVMLAKEESVVPTPNHMDTGHDSGDRKQREVAPLSQSEAESSRKSSDHAGFNKTNSMTEASSEMSSGQVPCGKEESQNEMEVDEVPPIKGDTEAPYNDTGTSTEVAHNERREQQKGLVLDPASRHALPSDERIAGTGEKVSVKSMDKDHVSREPLELTDAGPNKSQPAEIGGTSRPHASLSPIQSSKIHALPGMSLQTQPERPSKRKYSEEQRSLESPSLKSRSGKKLELDEVSSKIEERLLEQPSSVTPQKRCMELQTSPQENRQWSRANPLLPRSGSKLVAVKFHGGGVPVNNTASSSAIQASRMLPATGGNYSKFPEHAISVATLKPRMASSNDKAPEKKCTMLRGLQGLSLSTVVHQQSRSLYQTNSTRKFSNPSPFGEVKLGGKKHLEDFTSLKTSNLSALSKNKVLGASRETREKALKLDSARKGSVADPFNKLRTGVQRLRCGVEDREQKVLPGTLDKIDCRGPEKVDTVEDCEEKQPLDTVDKGDLGLVDIQTVEQEVNTDQADEGHPFMVTEADDGIYQQSENYADRLDQLLKELKDKHEEAMDLRARALVLNNTFLMLNNPVDEEKIRKIRVYVQEKLSGCRSLSVI